MEKIFSWVIDITFIILSILFLIFGTLSHDNYKYDTSIINEYKQNWELGPISDIVSVALNEQCPLNYKSLITNKFPGNKEGCDCRYSQKSEDKRILYDFPCSAKKLVNNCVSIYKQDDIDLEVWKGKKLCAKRLPKNFWELEELDSIRTNQNLNVNPSFIEGKLKKNLINSSTAKHQKLNLQMTNKSFKTANTMQNQIDRGAIICRDSDNYKPCGYLDETENILCIKKSETCPINEIIVLQKSQFEKLLFNQKAIYKSIYLSNDYYLYFTNQKTNGKVYVEVNAHVGNQNCIHPHEGILGQNNFLLNNLKGEKNCVSVINGKTKDPRYTLLDSFNMNEFYKENKIQKLIFDKITDYNLKTNNDKNDVSEFIYKQTDPNDLIRLYVSDYLGWKKTCFNFKGKTMANYVSSMLDTSQESVESAKRLINWIRLLCGFNLFFQIFVIVIVKMIWLNFKINFRSIFYFDVFNFLFILVLFILTFASHYKTQKILAPAHDFIQNKCGDEITNDVLSFAFDNISKIARYLLAIEVSVALQLVIYLALYGFVFREKFSFGGKKESLRSNESEDY